MGQASNSKRNASLDQKKERAAGRQTTRGRHQLNRDDFDTGPDSRHQVKGATGEKRPK
jgi:hypothetical protein